MTARIQAKFNKLQSMVVLMSLTASASTWASTALTLTSRAHSAPIRPRSIAKSSPSSSSAHQSPSLNTSITVATAIPTQRILRSHPGRWPPHKWARQATRRTIRAALGATMPVFARSSVLLRQVSLGREVRVRFGPSRGQSTDRFRLLRSRPASGSNHGWFRRQNLQRKW